MKKHTAIILSGIFVVLLFVILFTAVKYDSFIQKQNSYNVNETFTVANWNLQIFGEKKANNTELMNIYASTISKFDIVFIQEIRDKSNTSFWKLCGMLPDYNCIISTREGRTSSKEQYGVIYLKKYSVISLEDFNSDDSWERPPMRIRFSVNNISNYSITIYNIHTKPNETGIEIELLEKFMDSENDTVNAHANIMALGDMNADCSYYPERKSFLSWHWIISDTEDTSVAQSSCALDRIIVNDDLFNEIVDHGEYTDGIDATVSDHYLVWMRIRDREYMKNENFLNFLKFLKLQ